MSVQASSWAWEHSESAGNTRLVLLAIADAADREGANAWPSQDSIARMCRISVRTVRRCILELEELGELEVIIHGGPAYRDDRRPNKYRLLKMQLGTGGHPDPPSRPTGGHAEPTGGQTGSNGRTLLTGYPSSSNPSFSEQKNPSGGSLRDCAPPPTPTEEDPMPRTAPQSEALPLDLPEQPKAQGRKDEPSARTVVAAFVDSYRRHHSGGNPTRAVIGRVSRSAKAILTAGAAGPAELTAAATELGTGPYANLDTALAMHRQKGTRHMGTIAPCPPRGTFAEASNEADRQFCDQLKADPELAAWIVTDKAEASRLIALDPELSEVFAKVGAA